MARWLKIVNPSDLCHIDGSDILAACAAVVLLGRGRYALRDGDDNSVVPMFMFGGLDEWWAEHSQDRSFNEYMAEEPASVAKALRSVAYGSAKECEEQMSALNSITCPNERQQFIDENADKRRTSLNEIVRRAREIAERIMRKQEVNP